MMPNKSPEPLALAVPLSRFTSQVGGGSAFFVATFASHEKLHRHFEWSSRLTLPARELSQVTAYFSE